MFRQRTSATLQVFIWQAAKITRFNERSQIGFEELTLSFILQISWVSSPPLLSLPWRGFMKLRGRRQSLSSEGSATMNGSTCCPPSCDMLY